MSERFVEAYRAWRDTPFPKGSAYDLVDEFHAQLAQWDTYVAEVVVPFASGRPFDSGVLNITGELALFRRQLENAYEAGGNESDALAGYLVYCDLLIAAINAAEQDAGDGSSNSDRS